VIGNGFNKEKSNLLHSKYSKEITLLFVLWM